MGRGNVSFRGRLGTNQIREEESAKSDNNHKLLKLFEDLFVYCSLNACQGSDLFVFVNNHVLSKKENCKDCLLGQLVLVDMY